MTEELDRQMKGTILNYFATEGGAVLEWICPDDQDDDIED